MKTDPSQTRPAVPSVTDSRSPRADLACLTILGSIWLVMIALANPIGDFPLNDDWVYALAVKSILELGQFRLPSPASTNLLPQAYWGALFCLPFGFSFTALRISTLVLGFVGIAATYGIVRQLGTGARFALLAAALVAVNPLYFALANTFLTDVPFFAVSAASLYFLVKWALDPQGRYALAGLLLAMIALLIRQAGIVIPLAFAVAWVVVHGFRLKTVAIAALPVVIGVALHFGFQAWLQQGGGTPSAGEPPILHTVFENMRSALRVPLRLYIFTAYAGLLSLPVLVVIALRAWTGFDSSQRRTSVVVFVVACAVSAGAWLVLGKPMPFLDNILNDFGVGPLTLTDQYFLGRNRPVVPPWLRAIWYEVTLVTIVGAALLATVVVHGVRVLRRRSWPSPAAIAMIVVVGACLAYMLLGALALRFFYDRYTLFVLLATLSFAAVLAGDALTGSPSRIGVALLVVVVVAEAVVAVGATRDYLAWNRTRWMATSELLASGIPRSSIDGGYEFNGWLGYDSTYKPKPGKSPWWVVDDDYTIASGPLPGFSVLRTYPVPMVVPGRESRIFVLQRVKP